MNCPDADSLIGRYADDPAALGAVERRDLEQHLAGCEGCRIVLDDQRHVARLLHARPQVRITPTFAARLAARLDSEPQGILAFADWRRWTVGLTPVAAGLVLLAWLGAGSAATQPEAAAAPETFATWTEATATGDPAATFLQAASGDVLVEDVFTGVATPAGERDVR